MSSYENRVMEWHDRYVLWLSDRLTDLGRRWENAAEMLDKEKMTDILSQIETLCVDMDEAIDCAPASEADEMSGRIDAASDWERDRGVL